MYGVRRPHIRAGLDAGSRSRRGALAQRRTIRTIDTSPIRSRPAPDDPNDRHIADSLAICGTVPARGIARSLDPNPKS